MIYTAFEGFLQSLFALSKPKIIFIVIALILLLLVVPQVFVFACEAGTGGAGCPK